MRYILALLVLLVAAAGSVLAYRHITAGIPVVLPPPVHLAVHAGPSPYSSGWTNSSTVTLSADALHGVRAGADVEVRPADQAFRGIATSTAPGAGIDPSVSLHLPDGAFHWQIRLHNAQGVSPWEFYRGVIRIDTIPPATPTVSSPTDPQPGTLYHRSTLSFRWQSTDGASGVAGYSYRLDSNAHGAALPHVRTGTGTITLNGIPTGTWYFHVRAVDAAGNWSATSTFPVHIDVTPPQLTAVRFSTYQFDPQYTGLQVGFSVTRPAKVRVGVYRAGTLLRLYTLSGLRPGTPATVTWDGRDARGNLVPAGSYDIYARATDQWGHSSLVGWRDFGVNYQRIVVSLSQQRLWAYNGNQVYLTSLVTTGNRALPTPTGIFHIMALYHPYKFISPWPKSSPFYYPPSPVSYAMLFRDGGYFIHDAPWRTAFGPGTNAQLGTPGSNYTGTHGCINVPSDVAKELYDWVQIGTIVQVEQ